MRTFIHNFPENYPWYRKLFSIILFIIFGTTILPRKNKLSNKDIRRARRALKKGDIILGGDSRTLFSKLVRNPITHAMLYVGNQRVIHSIGADGVKYDSLTYIFTKYDTLLILRVPNIKRRKGIIKETIGYAKLQLKKPYDFELKPENEAFFCVELINKAFKEAKYETGLCSGVDKIIMKKSREAIKAHDFLKGNFDLIFKSHNLRVEGGKITYLQS